MGFRTIGQYVLEGAKNSHFMGTLPGFIVGEVCTRGYPGTSEHGKVEYLDGRVVWGQYSKGTRASVWQRRRV